MSTDQIESLRRVWRQVVKQHERTIAACERCELVTPVAASAMMLVAVSSEIRAQVVSDAIDLTDEIDADIRRLS